MALKLGELVAFLRTDNKQLVAGLAAGEAEVRRSGRQIERDGTATGRALSTAIAGGGSAGVDGFWRSADGRLRDYRGRFAAAGNLIGRAFGDGAQSGGRSFLDWIGQAGGKIGDFGSALGRMGSKASDIFTSLWSLIPALLILTAVATLTVPAVYLLGGALGSIPALAAGASVGIGALIIGFLGIADAFKNTAGAGGSVVDRAYQIIQAERRVRDANAESLASTEALARARSQAAENMVDLTRSLNGARLDQVAADRAVANARKALDAAIASGNEDRIADAQLAFQQAQQSADEVRDRVEDLAAEQAEAARKGVEGSDQVRDALARQQKAVEGVEDAQHDLAQAQKATSGGGAAEETTKLAASALATVEAIKALKPAWESLRLDVQQRLFAGINSEVKDLAAAWLPTLHDRLGGFADMWNRQLHNLATTTKNPEFISNVNSGILSVERMFDRIGTSITGPFTRAMGQLARAAGPFIDQLGESVGGFFDQFAGWIDEADKTGQLEDFFEAASRFLRDAFHIGGDVASIIGSIIAILFSAPVTTESPWEGLKRTLDGLAAWFKDPENRKEVQEWIQKIGDFFVWVATVGVPKLEGWITKLDTWIGRISGWGDRITGFRDRTVAAFDGVVGAVSGLPGRIDRASTGMWNGLQTGFKAAVNWIIGKWNGLSFTVGGGSFLGATIPSATFSTPDIPYLKDGGVVRATPGGRLAVVGDGPDDEIVAPEGKLRTLIAEAMASGGHAERQYLDPEFHVYIGDQELRGLVRVEVHESNRQLRRGVTAGAGTR